MTIELGHCTIDLEASEVRWSDRVEDLTPSECKLLAYLSSRPSEEVPRRDVLAEVWGYHPDSRTHTVAVVMRRLRKKLEVDPGQPMVLRTVRGRGWRFVLPDTPAAAAASNLRPTRDGFFGRNADLVALDGARLTTVVGPPGIGKSRLALEYASRTATEGRAREVWFSELGDADSEQDVAAGLAQILGVVLVTDGDWADRVGRALAARGVVLVVLDGADEVTGPVGRVLDRWLDLAPLCRFVVTSRQRLRIDGERVWTLSSLEPTEAEALFTDRASGRARLSDAAAVRTLVTRLDGVPLAIELIAARVGLRSVATLIEELDGHLPSADNPLAALRGAVTWTCDRLAAWERRALAQTSLFAGGFTLEAANAVLAPGAGHTGEDGVAALVDWSLLRRQAPAPGESVVRFDTFDMVSEYARAVLNEAPDTRREAVRQHAHHYGQLGTTEALAALRQTGGLARRRAMSQERANLAVAVGRGPSESAARCGLALAAVTREVGPVSQGEQVLAALLARPDLTQQARLRLELSLAVILFIRGNITAASESVERARVLSKSHAGPVEAARLAHLVCVIARRNNASDQDERFADALTSARATGDAAEQAIAESNLGLRAADQARYADAAIHHRRAKALSESVGDTRGAAIAAAALARVAWWKGDADGLARLEAALTVAGEIHYKRMVATLLVNLAEAYRCNQRLDDAMEAAEAAICLFAEFGAAKQYVATGTLGEVLLELGELDDARAALEHVVQRAERADWNYVEAVASATLAEVRARSGLDGLELVRSAIRTLERLGRLSSLAQAWCRLGQIALLDADRRTAEDALSRALETASDVASNPTVRYAIDRLRAALAEPASGGTETP